MEDMENTDNSRCGILYEHSMNEVDQIVDKYAEWLLTRDTILDEIWMILLTHSVEALKI